MEELNWTDAAGALTRAQSALLYRQVAQARFLLEDGFGFPARTSFPFPRSAERETTLLTALEEYRETLRDLDEVAEEERFFRKLALRAAEKDSGIQIQSRIGLASALNALGEVDQAVLVIQEAVSLADRSGDAYLRKKARIFFAAILSYKGRMREAIRASQGASRIELREQTHRSATLDIVLFANLAQQWLDLHDPIRAEPFALQSLEAVAKDPGNNHRVDAHLALAECHLQQRRLLEALRETHTALRVSRGAIAHHPLPTILCLLARVERARKHVSRAHGVLTRAAKSAGNRPSLRWMVESLRMQWAFEDDDPETFEKSLSVLREIQDRSPSWLWRATLAFWTGRMALQQGDQAGARAALQEALQLFRQVGVQGQAAEAKELLRKIRRPPERTGARETGPGAATQDLKGAQAAFASLLGNDARFLRVLTDAAAVAASEAPVLIVGETGTGKELLAQAIHQASSRAALPMVTLSCAAISETLIESELFGHERGAFTGASYRRTGRLSQADQSTLFLDEVDSIPLAIQSKLLRTLSEGEVQAIGSETVRRVDLRVIAAVQDDPLELVRRGRLRQDLYFRLGVVVLRIPPLRERPGDIPLLARHFLSMAAASEGRAATELSEEAETVLSRYSFPGNVRELENMMHRAVIMSDGRSIGLEDLPAAVRSLPPNLSGSPAERLQAARERAEREVLADVLRACNFDVDSTAKQFGLSRSQMYLLIRRHGLLPEHRQRAPLRGTKL